MEDRLNLISADWLEEYSKAFPLSASELEKLSVGANFSLPDFEHYVIASSVYSSRIEGNTLDLNSFMRNRSAASKSKEVQEIEDLVVAYSFAAENPITLPNFLNSHQLLSRVLLKKAEQGKYRKEQVGVFDSTTGRPVYLAVEAEFVKPELEKLFADIDAVLNLELTHQEVFYYASMIHLWIAMIHPFTDGNGRAARLLEKRFLASKLGYAAWSVNTEKYYWDNRGNYYKNIALGYNYYALHWDRCVAFLQMLPDGVGEMLRLR